MASHIFHTADDETIKAGGVTDVYFLRDVKILRALNINRRVRAEVRAASLPDGWDWALFAGIEEVAKLLEGTDVDLYAIEEGRSFGPEIPVLSIEGVYTEWAIYETALLGLICQASGVATRAARCRKAAGDRGVYSFGARRMHPAVTPMIERAAFIGGCDGVATTIAAELVGERPVGTMPHAMIITIGDEREAYRAYDSIIELEVPRVALVDTFNDEKFGALIAAEALGEKLAAVRLDTPGSRRGDFLKIMKEVRWELDLRGHKNVNIFVSGGIDEFVIDELNPMASGYGVGGYISNAPIVDFSLDIVEVEGEPIAKRGKMSGAKQVWRCLKCPETVVLPLGVEPAECCGHTPEPMLKKHLDGGRISITPPTPKEIRKRALMELDLLER